MHGGAAGFANHEVMAIEKLWNFFAPAFDGHTSWVLLFDFFGPAVNFPEVLTEDDGEFTIRPSGFK